MPIHAQLDEALSRGVEFVLAAQDPDGPWIDWSLPPGPSPDWTTADVGVRLSGLHQDYPAMLAEPLARAARWLLSRRAEGGGWGYNRHVQPDADSTAHALLFLSTAGCALPSEAYGFLARHQLPDGGFATFMPDALAGSWGSSHTEITPIALLALRTSPDGMPEDTLTRGLAWLRGVRRRDGLWNSFWWSTPLAATEVGLRLFAAIGMSEPTPQALARWVPGDSLEAALLLCLTAAGGPSARVEELVGRLIKEQRDDGSWRSTPTLRITARDCERPWETPASGALYSDPRRLHGTAVAIAALSKAKSALAS